VRHIERETAVARGASLQDFKAGADHFLADAVAGDGGDLVRSHRRLSEPAILMAPKRPSSRFGWLPYTTQSMEIGCSSAATPEMNIACDEFACFRAGIKPGLMRQLTRNGPRLMTQAAARS
jgi:hypothetical protein